MKICMAGSLFLPRTHLRTALAQVGVAICGSVTKDLDFLIVGEKAGSKVQKAKDLEVKTITLIDFLMENELLHHVIDLPEEAEYYDSLEGKFLRVVDGRLFFRNIKGMWESVNLGDFKHYREYLAIDGIYDLRCYTADILRNKPEPLVHIGAELRWDHVDVTVRYIESGNVCVVDNTGGLFVCLVDELKPRKSRVDKLVEEIADRVGVSACPKLPVDAEQLIRTGYRYVMESDLKQLSELIKYWENSDRELIRNSSRLQWLRDFEERMK